MTDPLSNSPDDILPISNRQAQREEVDLRGVSAGNESLLNFIRLIIPITPPASDWLKPVLLSNQQPEAWVYPTYAFSIAWLL